MTVADIWPTVTWFDTVDYEVPRGTEMQISVTAVNLGTLTETFYVTVYADLDPTIISNEITIDKLETTLKAGTGSGWSLIAIWYAGNTFIGNYTLTAVADTVPGETETANNVWFVIIEILKGPYLCPVPDTGFASTTLVGAGFSPNSTITITWGDTPIPTVPSPLITDSNGNFTAIISVLTPTDLGKHVINATDAEGNASVVAFTVIDMSGPQGPAGETGPQGETGPKGDPRAAAPTEHLWASIILAIIAICIAAYAVFKKR